jgi:hypothetical protein
MHWFGLLDLAENKFGTRSGLCCLGSYALGPDLGGYDPAIWFTAARRK